MTKVFVTKKWVRENYGTKRIYQVPYCALQSLLRNVQPFGYHAGIYGWNCDFYELRDMFGDRVVLSTGYNPTGNKVPSIITALYEHKAKELDAYTDKDKLAELVELYATNLYNSNH